MTPYTLIINYKRKAFSLVEVVVAVGIFAIAILSVIGVLTGVGRSVGEVVDTDKASRLVGVVQARLQASSFSTIVASLKTDATVAGEATGYDPSADTRVFFANEDGSIVAPYNATSAWEQNDPTPTITERDALKFFELTLIRNPNLSPANNDGSAGFLAFTIRIRWPAFLPNGTRVTDHTQKEVLMIPAVITR